MTIATLSAGWLIISMALILGLPGFALGRVLLPSVSIDRQVALAPAVSIACWAMLWLFATLVRLPVNTFTVVAGLLLAGAIVFANRLRPSWRTSAVVASAWLLGVALIGIALRLYWWREAVTALGSDGYHHSLISQLLIDNQGLPNNYEPYAPIESFSYHFAFHSLVASLHMITGRDAVSLTLLMGQIISMVGLLPLYALVRQLGGGARAGIVAVVAAALLSAFPAFFINWSRLTQMTALAIIPAALAVTVAFLDDEQLVWRTGLLAALLVGALFTAHYLIVLFYLYALGLLFLFRLIEWVHVRQPLVRRALRLVPLGVGALLFAGYWIYRLAVRFVPQVALSIIDGSADSGYYDIGGLGISWDSYRVFLLAAAVAALVLIWLRQRGVLWLTVWAVLSVGYSNPYWLSQQLPGIGRLDLITVLTSCYIPAAVVLGLAWERVWHALHSKANSISGAEPPAGLDSRRRSVATHNLREVSHYWPTVALALASFGIAIAGMRLQSSLFVPSERYVQQPDIEAAHWLATSTPAGSVIMSNCFAWPWSPNYIVSADAGGWMPLLADRPSIIPPIIRNLEWVPDTGLSQRLTALCTGLSNAPESNQTTQLLRQNNIALIYLGERDGFIDPNRLASLSDRYKLIYHNDKVEIFQVMYK